MARGRFILGLLSGVVLTGGVAAGGLYAFGGVIAPLLMGTPSIPKPPPASASAASQQAMADAKARVEAMCQKLLANTVIENYQVEIA